MRSHTILILAPLLIFSAGCGNEEQLLTDAIAEQKEALEAALADSKEARAKVDRNKELLARAEQEIADLKAFIAETEAKTETFKTERAALDMKLSELEVEAARLNARIKVRSPK